jgi:hypothetical protein
MTTDNFCFHLQNRPIQTSQTGGQQYSDTFPFSIPWSGWCILVFYITEPMFMAREYSLSVPTVLPTNFARAYIMNFFTRRH